MQKLPYPPPPEPGWGDEDVAAASANATAQPEPTPTPAEPLLTSSQPIVGEADDDQFDGPLEYTAAQGATGSEEWDGTVLSTAFMTEEAPQAVYRMVNDVTGQNITVDMGVLLGRKPSQDIPQGAKSVRLVDPTRTVSRNHAAISFDQDGTLWIEDYGSLNGTFVIDAAGEHKVEKGKPMQLTAPVKVRIGDQVFDFEQV
ncbi:FHA domain-containing protein [Bifidobacterium cuniculi]|nr:FHA domain-containing protein [Bifidobacterium cuniculi]